MPANSIITCSIVGLIDSKSCPVALTRTLGRLAQLVRASGLHPEGRRFESCTAHQSGHGMNSRRTLYVLCLALAVAGLLFWYAASNRPSAVPIGRVVEIKAPLGLPPVPIPADNPPTVRPSPWAAACITTRRSRRITRSRVHHAICQEWHFPIPAAYRPA